MSESYFNLISKQIKPTNIVIQKGARLFSQGKIVSRMFYIKSGVVKLSRYNVDGMPIILHVATSQETIAEASLFSKNYHCSAIATVKSEIAAIDKKQLIYYIENNPQAMKKLLLIFSKQVLDLRAINEIKNIRCARERVLVFLQSQMDDYNKVKLNISIKDMAYKIGLAHETFYRELKQLEKIGSISRKYGYINICV